MFKWASRRYLCDHLLKESMWSYGGGVVTLIIEL